jgi:hypothetical protein
MRAMMEAQGFDDKLIDVIFWKITGSMQRFIWWQSLLKNCLLLAFFWGVFFAVDKSLPWQFSPLFLVLLTATDYWTFRRSQRPRND